MNTKTGVKWVEHNTGRIQPGMSSHICTCCTILYTVHCSSLYTVQHCTLYTVQQCTLVQHCTLYTVQHCTLYTVQHCALYNIVHCTTLYTVVQHCTIYTFYLKTWTHNIILLRCCTVHHYYKKKLYTLHIYRTYFACFLINGKKKYYGVDFVGS